MSMSGEPDSIDEGKLKPFLLQKEDGKNCLAKQINNHLAL